MGYVLSMKRRLGLLVATVMLGSLVISPAAHAVTTGYVQVPDVVLYESCADHPYSYAVSPEPGYTDDVTLNVITTGPDGLEADTDHISYEGPSTDDFLLCGDILAGSYAMTVTGRACNDDYQCYNFALPPTSFQVRFPHTATSLKVTPKHPRKSQIVRLQISSKDERPAGYFPNDYAGVFLEQKKPGKGWLRVRHSKTTTKSNGKVTLQYRYRGGRIVVRAATAPIGYHEASYSRQVTITRR